MKFVTDHKGALKTHIQSKHILKKCNECEYATYSLKDLKDNQHKRDDFPEKSAFNKFMYQKTWKVRGVHDPLSSLQAYKSKIRNEICDYIGEKEAVTGTLE